MTRPLSRRGVLFVLMLFIATSDDAIIDAAVETKEPAEAIRRIDTLFCSGLYWYSKNTAI